MAPDGCKQWCSGCANMAFRIGDLVWGKMKGFPYWPGIVKEPPEELKNKNVKPGLPYVHFFGSENCGYLEEDCLKMYESGIQDVKNSPKSPSLIKAIEEIEHFISSSNTTHTMKSSMKMAEVSEIRTNFSPGNTAHSESNSKTEKKSVSNLPSIRLNEFKEMVQSSRTTPKQAPRRRLSSVSFSEEIEVKQPRYSQKTVNDIPARRRSRSNPPKIKKSISTNTHQLANKKQVYFKPSTAKVEFVSPVSEGKNSSLKDSINRPSAFSSGAPQDINIQQISEIVKARKIEPSKHIIGFLGADFLGTIIVENLALTGHKVVIWNRTEEKSIVFKKVGVKVLDAPSDVVALADITFCCVSNTNAANDLVWGNFGVLKEMTPNKAFIEMSVIDAETSMDICEEIERKGGKYLEVRCIGDRQAAIDGRLIVLASGDYSAYTDCLTCFRAVGHSFFLNNLVGTAAKLNSIFLMFIGTNIAALAQSFALASKLKVTDDLMNCIKYSKLSAPFVNEGINAITGKRNVDLVLGDLQKCIEFGLNDASKHNLPLPLGAAVHQVFLHAKSMDCPCDPLSLYRVLTLY